jgi:hypothetical protein
MPKRKLKQYEWLEASLISFNGSGYADRRSAEQYMDSYLAYQQFKDRPYGMTMADRYWSSGLVVAQVMIDTSDGPSRRPSYYSLKAFSKYYPAALEYEK